MRQSNERERGLREEWADWMVQQHNFCERNAGESLKEIAMYALKHYHEMAAAAQPAGTEPGLRELVKHARAFLKQMDSEEVGYEAELDIEDNLKEAISLAETALAARPEAAPPAQPAPSEREIGRHTIEELLPCPFCAGAYVRKEMSPYTSKPCLEELTEDSDGKWRVNCYGCHVSTWHVMSRAEAIETWNRRAAQPANRKQIIEECVRVAFKTPFRAHAIDDVDFHSGCVQTKGRIVDALCALAAENPARSATPETAKGESK